MKNYSKLITVAISYLLVMNCLLRGDEVESAGGLFKAEGVLETILSSDRVSACPLKSNRPNRKFLFWGYRDWSKRTYKEKKYVSISKTSVQNIREDLLDDNSYVWGIVLGCRPIFQSRCRFEKGFDRVEIDFCFGCSIMLVRFNGNVVSSAVVDLSNTVFLDEMITLFPNEEMFAQAKEMRANRTGG